VPTRNGKLKTGLLARESFANLASFPSSLPIPVLLPFSTWHAKLQLHRCFCLCFQFFSFFGCLATGSEGADLEKRRKAEIDAIFGIFAMTTSEATTKNTSKPVRKRNKFSAMTPQLPFAFYVFMLEN